MMAIVVVLVTALATALIEYRRLHRKQWRLNARNTILRRTLKQGRKDFEQLQLVIKQLSEAHDQRGDALLHAWLTLLLLFGQHEALRRELMSVSSELHSVSNELTAASRKLTSVSNERTRLKQELLEAAKASVAHLRSHEGAERKIKLLIEEIIELQVKLSTLHAVQVRAKNRLIEEFVRKVIELIFGGKLPT